MDRFTDEKNTLMLLSLMKSHGIKKIIASPGGTNVAFVASLQADPWFEVYSSVDERSAAYIACGLAAESGEPVALSCTQATASRNYFPGLTEAYYRKLPVLAITSTQHLGRIGQNIQQAIDRSSQPADTVNLSVHVPVINTTDDEWYCNVLLNRALLELRRNGGGPVHINLTTTYSSIFNVKTLPKARVINRIGYMDSFPTIDSNSRVGIYVGAHKKWDAKLTKAVDNFCEKYGAVVLCDQISNYKSKYRINYSLLLSQMKYKTPANKFDILIHIGDVTGSTTAFNTKEVWRVNPDGEIRDAFRKMRYVFEMEEYFFFNEYAKAEKITTLKNNHYNEWKSECCKVTEHVPNLPLSNIWLASVTLPCLPENSVLHLGIYNSLRTWSYFEAPDTVLGYSNTGGFGIDGGLSSVIGASLTDNRLYFAVIGDLAFFYDINSLGNRHVGKNLRILLINNGCGYEFKNPRNRAYALGNDADPFIAAQGHYGNKSRDLVKHFSNDLGFIYLSAENKEEYIKKLPEFLSAESKQSMIFEVFIDIDDENKASDSVLNIITSTSGEVKSKVKSIIGKKNVDIIKKIIK